MFLEQECEFVIGGREGGQPISVEQGEMALIDAGAQHPERIFLLKEAHKDRCDKCHALNVPDLCVEMRIRSQDAVQRFLFFPVFFLEHDMLGKGPRNVFDDGFVDLLKCWCLVVFGHLQDLAI